MILGKCIVKNGVEVIIIDLIVKASKSSCECYWIGEDKNGNKIKVYKEDIQAYNNSLI